MTLWCLSGFVMMYQGYPSTTDEERRLGLLKLNFSDCCGLSGQQLDALAATPDFQIESLNGGPVLRLGNGFRATLGSMLAGDVVNLKNGEVVAALTESEILVIARDFALGNEIAGEPHIAGIIDIDQWTVQTARRNAPVHNNRFGDPAGTEQV